MGHSVPSASDKSVPEHIRKSFRRRRSKSLPHHRLPAGPAAMVRSSAVNHGGVTDLDLIRRAQNAGIATSYENSRHECVDVPAETLAAILAVLEDSGETAADAGLAATRPAVAQMPRPVVPASPPVGLYRAAVLGAVPGLVGPRGPARPRRARRAGAPRSTGPGSSWSTRCTRPSRCRRSAPRRTCP